MTTLIIRLTISEFIKYKRQQRN